MARLDRLVFYNAYAIWREAMGEQGVNLKDIRYGFNAVTLECTREFARRAMCEDLPDRPRNHELVRKRCMVNHTNLDITRENFNVFHKKKKMIDTCLSPTWWSQNITYC